MTLDKSTQQGFDRHATRKGRGKGFAGSRESKVLFPTARLIE